MADDLLLAAYPKQQVTRDRNSSALLAWAGYTATLPIPPDKPDEAWVRLRLVSERIPTAVDSYVSRTMAYFQQDPSVQEESALRQFLSAWNDVTVETALSATNATVIGTFMPRFAATDTTQAQVQEWYNANGFPDSVVTPS